LLDTKSPPTAKTAREWLQVLADYREPSLGRSVLEIFLTASPLIVLWGLAWWALSISFWLTLLFAIPASTFLVRLFLIQHDCGHGAFFQKKATNDWVGRFLGVMTLTPYFVWRRSHAIHHSTSGNLDKRGTGDIDTLTVREYQALPAYRRLYYRIYRHPIVLFGIGPSYLFLVQNRFPAGFWLGGWRYWASAMGTNLGIAAFVTAMIWLVGVKSFLFVHLPIVMLAASIGVWLFYVQHQFEETSWEGEPGWNQHEAALRGSSYYDLPGGLRWLTGNIGVHHVHHLYSRIPYYKLQRVLDDHPELTGVKRITLQESFACVRLRLWDEGKRKLVSFREARFQR
jgi:acyl-lipid omega-6 desaturase (Delta-12 desaturase)